MQQELGSAELKPAVACPEAALFASLLLPHVVDPGRVSTSRRTRHG
ncbi:hypothetical protein ABZ208_20695 [Streptomyces sp. NPDC006208]